MENSTPISYSVKSKLLLPALAVSAISTWIVPIVFQILLIDIAADFQVQVGTTSMTAAVGSIAGIAFGLLMAVVSVRINHKLLLLGGLACSCLGGLGYYFSPDFPALLVSNIGVGSGMAVVNAMVYSIIGDNFPLERRGRAVGVIVASGTIATLICGLSVSAISTFGDWRMSMILLTLPFVLVSLALVAFCVPLKARFKVEVKKESFLVGCKKAFSSVSTVAALLVTMFMFCEANTGYYSVSFFRDQFAFSVTLGSSLILVAKLIAMVGSIVAGLVVDRVGRKKLGAITFGIASILSLTFMVMPTMELSSVLCVLNFFFSSMAVAAGGCLILELLPSYRSTVMSLNAVFMNIGMLVSSLIAGLMLNTFGYQAVGLVLGGLGLVGVVVWVTLVKEPVQQKKPN